MVPPSSVVGKTDRPGPALLVALGVVAPVRSTLSTLRGECDLALDMCSILTPPAASAASSSDVFGEPPSRPILAERLD